MLAAAANDPRGTRSETTVLFLAANPVETQLLQIGEECRAIEEKIRAARFREKLRFRSRWAARPDDLLQALHEDDPTVLHFSGHGVGAQGLLFLAEDGHALLVNSDGLGQVIRAAGDSIQLVVLNACYSRIQAEALVLHVPCVIGMPSAIGDKSAIVYAAELYRALAFGKSVANAHQCGLAALALHSMAGTTRDVDMVEAVLRTAPPELLARTGVDASHVHIVQGALPASTVPASSGESRIHLEIDIEGDFETLDASTLGKLVSEICQLSGGRPARILCVTKGSIRLRLSFEPDAARALMSLRDSGRLNEISGLQVLNVVELGQVEISPQALDHADMLDPDAEQGDTAGGPPARPLATGNEAPADEADVRPGSAGRRVLVVDDHPDSADASCMLLSALGYECRPAVTGENALAEVERFQPDVVICDIGLPDISGYDIARTLRSRHGSSLYLVALTAWDQPSARVRALAAGFDEYLVKPANARALRAVMIASMRALRPSVPASSRSLE